MISHFLLQPNTKNSLHTYYTSAPHTILYKTEKRLPGPRDTANKSCPRSPASTTPEMAFSKVSLLLDFGRSGYRLTLQTDSRTPIVPALCNFLWFPKAYQSDFDPSKPSFQHMVRGWTSERPNILVGWVETKSVAPVQHHFPGSYPQLAAHQLQTVILSSMPPWPYHANFVQFLDCSK